jgi:gliding motility-associated protein GldM
MALPKEPRQKMINIMYLVLTAILALNVSSEILNAFQTIDDSFGKSNAALKTRSELIIKEFGSEQNKAFAEKVAIWKPKAQMVSDLSDQAFAFIENIKKELKMESGLKAPDTTFKLDDLEASTRVLVEGKDEGKGKTKMAKGEEIYNMLTKYKADLAKIDPLLALKVGNIPVDLSIPKLYNKDAEKTIKNLPIPKQWATIYFHMTPTIAALAMMSKFQNDIRNTQTQLIDFCYSQVNTTFIQLKNFDAIASANATTVSPGEEVEITAVLGSYNSDAKPSISIDGASVPIGPDGKALYKMVASAPGDYSKHVTINFINPSTGAAETRSTDVKFKVVTPTGLSLSTDKTRVFYAGLQNPISISGAAGGAGALKVSASGNASISPGSGPGNYIVTVNSAGTVTINVSDGKSSKSFNIPAKEVPTPKVGVNADFRTYGTITADKLVSPGIINAILNDFIFEGVNFQVTSFNVQFDDGTSESNGGPVFNGTIKSKIRASQSGDRILIYNINYKTPTGQIKPLTQGLSFDIY